MLVDKNWIKSNLYYIIVAIISAVILILFPMFGSDIEIGWGFPEDSAGWFFWAVTKSSVILLNLIILYAFIRQAELNVKTDERYIKAKNLLIKNKAKKEKIISPQQFDRHAMAKKGITLTVTTALSLIAFGQALINFDYIVLISYIITLGLGILSGIFAMKDKEEYFVEGAYMAYAIKKGEETNDTTEQQSIQEP